MLKNYILDTNVLLHDPHAIHSFEDNTVLIPIQVIEEIDTFKRQSTELGRNARSVSRILDGYRSQGKLSEGVDLNNEGRLVVLVPSTKPWESNGSHASVDNALLKLAVDLQAEDTDKPVVLVTKDTNLRIKADALGLKAQDFETGRVGLDELYRGVDMMEVDRDTVERLKEGEPISLPGHRDYFANEYVWLSDNGEPTISALGRVDAEARMIRPLLSQGETVMGVKPRNKEQYFAVDALMDPEVALVTLMGKAGTGKTLLALAAGLSQVLKGTRYSRLLVSRPVYPMGRDLGYLPGELEEKLNPWMQPIYDNLDFLLDRGGRNNLSMNKLMNNGTLSLEAITYIRGRSIPNQYIIVDEAQNLTPLEVKTIITRVGENAKIVLTGDPQQIDNPYVDASTNGFNYLVQRFRPESISAHVELTKGERSELAELASDLL